jgi:transposase
VRHGTTDLFAALDVASGRVIAETHRRHRSAEFRHFLGTVERATPADLELHLVLDNSSIHKTPQVHRWLVRHPRVHLHFTPTSSSWLNLVESWFAHPAAARARPRRVPEHYALERAIRQLRRAANTEAKPFVWTKTADEILASVARYCEHLSNSDH